MISEEIRSKLIDLSYELARLEKELTCYQYPKEDVNIILRLIDNIEGLLTNIKIKLKE